MVRRKKTSVADDNALRALYEACGLAPPVIEAAIKKRYEEPTNFIAREKAVAAIRVARAPQKSSGQRPTRRQIKGLIADTQRDRLVAIRAVW